MEFQKEELDEILNIFQQESSEIISSMDEKLLKLEKDSKDSHSAMQLFRDAHSLKGSARMLGFNDIQNIAHKIEDIISLVREEKLIITPSVTDTISECLEFISMLINKTVAQKEEFKSPDIQKYIEKLEELTKNTQEKEYINADSDINIEKKKFLSNFENIEKLITNILYIISSARARGDFERIFEIENKTKDFIFLINDIKDENIEPIIKNARKIIDSIEDYRVSNNKDFSFLEVNNAVIALIDSVSNFADKEKIKRQDYYEAVNRQLEKEMQKQEEKQIKQAIVLEDDKIEELFQKLPLIEINNRFSFEIASIIDSMLEREKNPNLTEIFLQLKQTLDIFQKKDIIVTHDIVAALQEVLGLVKNKTEKALDEAKLKINVIKTLASFQYKEHKKEEKKRPCEASQKDILNTITNSEIKTLKVDSLKLDNLVGQVGELIVSKIKTNEQLSLGKKINNDLLEFQKNFFKMGYYIKYFDKKYLSNSFNPEIKDYRKMAAYNRQLCTLTDQHFAQVTEILRGMSNLLKQLEESETKLNSTTNEIETMIKNMRILPLSTIFQLFPRMVHNIARDKNKKIELVIQGADVAADKTIIEEIKIPLMHIIRNSIDHGIESVEARKALRKNPVGTIEISASYKDNKVVIDVKDDGRGLDVEKIKMKALEKKLLTPEEIGAINDDELTNLIFYPGFSTEDFATELSGRGLGLDIVNNKINQLQGRIDVFSQLNQGTIVRITLPSSIASKKVFIIEEQNQLWAIETSVIKTIVRINSDEIFEKDNRSYYIYNNNAIMICTLSQILNFENTPRESSKCTLMIIETESTIFGIIVERLISDQEIVHKKLSPPLYKVKHISGITTLASGEACLILNISDIIATVGSKKINAKIITKNGILKARDNFKYKILVVDDSYTTRILQKNILSNCGYSVSTATDAQDALNKVAQTNYDLIISDVQMPGMNGFEFITELRKMQYYNKIPVIVVSSMPEEKYTKEIRETGIVTYIQKNLFKQKELVDCIEGILNY